VVVVLDVGDGAFAGVSVAGGVDDAHDLGVEVAGPGSFGLP